MGDQEIKKMESSQNLSNEEKKRRKLEEDMRKEKEARLKKRRELMKKEDEYEEVEMWTMSSFSGCEILL